MAKKKKEKIKRIEGSINLDELMEKYKLPEEDLVEKINYFVDDELSYDSELDDDQLYELVMRSLRLSLRGHAISNAEVCEVFVIGLAQPNDYGANRRKVLKEMFALDPKRATTEGFKDCVCDGDGNIVYKSTSWKKGEYPDHAYRYPVIMVLKNSDGKFKTFSMTVFEDGELKWVDQIIPEKWFSAKLIVDKHEEIDYDLTGRLSKLTEFQEIKLKQPEFIDISKGKDGEPKNEGLIFSDTFGSKIIKLSECKQFFDTFQKDGFLADDKWITVIGDVASINESGTALNVLDDSLEDETYTITVWDNRNDKSIRYGPRSKILIFGQLRYDNSKKEEEAASISAWAIYPIPKEKGGFFYPIKIEPTDEIKSKTGTASKSKTTSKSKATPAVSFDRKKVNQDIQNSIVTSLYALDGKATYKEILEKTDLKEDEAYKASFKELISRKIFVEKDGGYEI